MRSVEHLVRARLIFGATVIAVLAAGAAVWLTAGGDDGDDGAVIAHAGGQSDADTSATALHADDQYCGTRSGAELIEQAGRLTGSGNAESEGAWVMSAAGLAALDPELAAARDGGRGATEVFVIPVADGDGQDLDPPGPAVTVDERTWHTAVVVLDCDGGQAVRLLPAGFFPFGEPAEFLDRGSWFTEWTSPDGRAATGEEISEHHWTAADHCSWPDVAMLWFDGAQYVKDPGGVFDGWSFESALDLDADLPADAVDTGYRKGGVELWLSPPGAPAAAYLVGPEATERWPRPVEPIGCA